MTTQKHKNAICGKKGKITLQRPNIFAESVKKDRNVSN